MNYYQLLIDLHRGALRQGPGGDTESRKALKMAELDISRPLKIADIGYGTGSSALLLASELDASITAVDSMPEFLDERHSRACILGVANKITSIACSMDCLPFADEELDVIWSEGAIYNIGFEAGVTGWRKFLKPGGKLIVYEITWLSGTRPLAIQSHWEKEYTEVDVASSKIKILERHGYVPEAYFVLPTHCWHENYYQPMQARFEQF